MAQKDQLNRSGGIDGALLHDRRRDGIPAELQVPVEAAAEQLDTLLVGERAIVDYVDNRADNRFSESEHNVTEMNRKQ